MMNACTIRLYLEDHTIGNLFKYWTGNLVRISLLKNKDVTFAGYRQIHPLQHTIEIKVQTNGAIKPYDALMKAFKDLADDVKTLEDEWVKKVAEKDQHQMKVEI